MDFLILMPASLNDRSVEWNRRLLPGGRVRQYAKAFWPVLGVLYVQCLVSAGFAAANRDLGFGNAKLFGNKLNQLGVGFAVNGGRSDTDFQTLAILPRKFILAGLGLQVAKKG